MKNSGRQVTQKIFESLLSFADRVGRIDTFANSLQETSKARLLVLCAPIFGVQAAILIGQDVIAGHAQHWVIRLIGIVATASLLATPFIVRQTRSTKWAGINLCVWVCASLILSAFARGGFYSNDMAIIVGLPLLVGFIVSRNGATLVWVMLLGVFTALWAGHVTGAVSSPVMPQSADYFSKFLFAVVATSSVFAITYAFSLLNERSYQEFLEENRRLELSLDVAGAAIWSLDRETAEFFCTPRLHEIYGRRITREEMTADPFGTMVHADDQERILDAWERHEAGRSSQFDECFRFERGDGEICWLHSHFQLQPSMSGESTRILGFMTDVTEQKHAELELEQAKELAEESTRLKSEFLANISHEIRTPLNGILGMTQALKSRNLGTEEAEMVDTLTDSGKTLIAILNDVLDLSKIEAGKLELSPVEGDLRHAFNRVHKLFLASAEEKQLECSLTIDDSVPTMLRFDPVRVRQCVSNLVSNAVKFTSEGSVSIRVECRRDSRGNYGIRVEVSDTGIGMDEATIDRLFQPFTQGDGSATRSVGGTGLGLVISRRLANLMGGDVSVQSDAGRGSTFTLTFNAERSQNQARPPRGEPSQIKKNNLSRLRVLLVDDNFVNRKVAKIFLEPYQMDIEEAQNGREALELLAERDAFDVVLLDVHMPLLDGVQTIRQIRASESAWKSVPVIALTADAMSGDKERYLELGMSGYVSKPIDQSELLSEMARVLSVSITPNDASVDQGGGRSVRSRS